MASTSHPEELLEGDLPRGTSIGAYRVEATIGAGGMGFVYRASHAITQRTAAIKVMREDQLAQDRAVDRMMREASILASVSHPGVPQFFECGILDDGRPWIAMELVAGAPLADRMKRELIPADEVIQFVQGVAEVLAAAHERGVTHRDLKPDNILMTPDCERCRVRVIDWGIAHAHAGSRLTNMNEAIGTPTYMAPEQARGGPTDGYCDVYGLGIVAYQALTGRPPFLGSTSIEILVQHLNRPVPALAPRCPDAPYGLVELVEAMLSKNYEERPSAAEVAHELRRLQMSTSVRQSTQQLLDRTDGVPRVTLDEVTVTTASLRGPRHSSVD